MNQKQNNSSAYEWENLYRSPVLLFYYLSTKIILGHWHTFSSKLFSITDQSQKHAKQWIVALSVQI